MAIVRRNRLAYGGGARARQAERRDARRLRWLNGLAVAALVVVAIVILAGCSGQRPTIAAQPEPSSAPATEGTQPLVTCADWNAQVATPGAVPARFAWISDYLRAERQRAAGADEGKFLAGLNNYCRLLPADPLLIAAQSVVLCLWPDPAQPLRGPDCAAVQGRGCDEPGRPRRRQKVMTDQIDIGLRHFDSGTGPRLWTARSLRRPPSRPVVVPRHLPGLHREVRHRPVRLLGDAVPVGAGFVVDRCALAGPHAPRPRLADAVSHAGERWPAPLLIRAK
jgi:hypothetical protein